tara:strand:- start:168 stop:806 length:639 start_codon:yes stop_codon:yes gene_type:complete
MATKAELQASLDAKGVDYTQGMTNTKLQSLLDEHDANASASSGFEDLIGEENTIGDRNIGGTFQQYVDAIGKANKYKNPTAFPTDNAVDANSTTRFALEIGDADAMVTDANGVKSFKHSKRITCSESVSKMLKAGDIGYSEIGAFPVAWRMIASQDPVSKLYVENKVYFVERPQRVKTNDRFAQGGFSKATVINEDFEETRTMISTLSLSNA